MVKVFGEFRDVSHYVIDLVDNVLISHYLMLAENKLLLYGIEEILRWSINAPIWCMEYQAMTISPDNLPDDGILVGQKIVASEAPLVISRTSHPNVPAYPQDKHCTVKNRSAGLDHKINPSVAGRVASHPCRDYQLPAMPIWAHCMNPASLC